MPSAIEHTLIECINLFSGFCAGFPAVSAAVSRSARVGVQEIYPRSGSLLQSRLQAEIRSGAFSRSSAEPFRPLGSVFGGCHITAVALDRLSYHDDGIGASMCTVIQFIERKYYKLGRKQ